MATITREEIQKEATEKMNRAVEVVDHELGALRTGRASTHLLDGVKVDMYGSQSPVNQLANISTPDASSILISPWDKAALKPMSREFFQANIGFTPSNDGKVIRLTLPAMTEQTRKELVKRAHGIAEEGRVAIRNVRRKVNDEVKANEKKLALDRG